LRLSVGFVALALAPVGLMLRFHFACKPLLLVELLAVIFVRFVALPINGSLFLLFAGLASSLNYSGVGGSGGGTSFMRNNLRLQT
jgi:hypothetical protein